MKRKAGLKIRGAGKNSTTLEVSLDPKMKEDGFVAGAFVDFVKVGEAWTLQLRKDPTPYASTIKVPTELVNAIVEKVMKDNKITMDKLANPNKEVEQKVSD